MQYTYMHTHMRKKRLMRVATHTQPYVNLDLAVEDLLERLKAGKIYPADRIPWALEHFFRDSNLSTLRELSLREVAQSLDRAAIRQPSAAPAVPDTQPTAMPSGHPCQTDSDCCWRWRRIGRGAGGGCG